MQTPQAWFPHMCMPSPPTPSAPTTCPYTPTMVMDLGPHAVPHPTHPHTHPCPHPPHYTPPPPLPPLVQFHSTTLGLLGAVYCSCMPHIACWDTVGLHLPHYRHIPVTYR